MTELLTRLLGRLPIGWLQLTHNRSRLAAAIAGVSFANILVFVQLGIMGALNTTITATYGVLDADILVSAEDAQTINDGGNVPRQSLLQSLSVPGVRAAAPLYLGTAFFEVGDGSLVNFQVIALDPGDGAFLVPQWREQLEELRTPGTALIDASTRGLDEAGLAGITRDSPRAFELAGRRMQGIGTVRLGAGFSADGALLVSDQTFFRLFPNRSSAAPDHIMIRAEENARLGSIASDLEATLRPAILRVRTIDAAIQEDLSYQMTKRPTGLIFGFGVIVGVIVGLIIVYQILSTDVADHLTEYATFKAMGYRNSFFVGVVLEEAMLLALLGFVPGFVISNTIYFGLASATGLPISMTFGRAVMVLVGTAVACGASGAIATRRLAASDPAELF